MPSLWKLRDQVIASARCAAVARRCGFALEGTLHNIARHHLTNELYDELLFYRL